MELRDLEPLEFDLNSWVKSRNKLESVMVRVPGKNHPDKGWIEPHFITMPFFGHVFVGFDSIPDSRWQSSLVSDLKSFQAPSFKCPSAWTMAKILGALKAFSSVGDAKRNGWDFKPTPGWDDHKVRIAKVQGILTVVTPTEIVLRTDSF